MLSLPPGMPPPSASEMECVCTYDEMFGPFRKAPVTPAGPSAHSSGSPTGGQTGPRALKRERTSNSERGIGSDHRGARAGSSESDRDSEGWNKAHQLEMENRESHPHGRRPALFRVLAVFGCGWLIRSPVPSLVHACVSVELKRQLQATLQHQQQQHHHQPPHPALPLPNGYPHHAPPSSYTSSSRYERPPSPSSSSHPHHQSYYPPPPPPLQQHPPYSPSGAPAPFQLPQLATSAYGPPKSSFPWSSNYPAGSTVTSSYPMSAPGYQESPRGGLPALPLRGRPGPSPPSILEALNIQPTPTSQAQRLGAEIPPHADPVSPSTSSVTSATNPSAGPHLPPLLHPVATSDSHVHYPFVSQQQQDVFHLPPLAARFSDVKLGKSAPADEGDEQDNRDRGSSTGSLRPDQILDGSTLLEGEDGSEWRKRVEDRTRIWALMGGKEVLQKKSVPLLSSRSLRRFWYEACRRPDFSVLLVHFPDQCGDCA